MSEEWSRHGLGHPGWDLRLGLCLCPAWTRHGKGQRYTGASVLRAVVSPGCLRQSCTDLAQPDQGLRPSASCSPNHSVPCCLSGPLVLQVSLPTSPLHLEPLLCTLPVLPREDVCPLPLFSPHPHKRG